MLPTNLSHTLLGSIDTDEGSVLAEQFHNFVSAHRERAWSCSRNDAIFEAEALAAAIRAALT